MRRSVPTCTNDGVQFQDHGESGDEDGTGYYRCPWMLVWLCVTMAYVFVAQGSSLNLISNDGMTNVDGADAASPPSTCVVGVQNVPGNESSSHHEGNDYHPRMAQVLKTGYNSVPWVLFGAVCKEDDHGVVCPQDVQEVHSSGGRVGPSPRKSREGCNSDLARNTYAMNANSFPMWQGSTSRMLWHGWPSLFVSHGRGDLPMLAGHEVASGSYKIWKITGMLWHGWPIYTLWHGWPSQVSSHGRDGLPLPAGQVVASGLCLVCVSTVLLWHGWPSSRTNVKSGNRTLGGKPYANRLPLRGRWAQTLWNAVRGLHVPELACQPYSNTLVASGLYLMWWMYSIVVWCGVYRLWERSRTDTIQACMMKGDSKGRNSVDYRKKVRRGTSLRQRWSSMRSFLWLATLSGCQVGLCNAWTRDDNANAETRRGARWWNESGRNTAGDAPQGATFDDCCIRRCTRGGVDTDLKKVLFQLVLDTVNVTSWAAGQEYLTATPANLVCMQEHKLADMTDIDGAARWADTQGWTSIWSAAKITLKGGHSGGVAVFARRGIGIRDGGIVTDEEHRLLSAIIEAPGAPKFDLTSSYFRTGTGMTGTNASLMADLVQHRATTKRPGIVAGDFNNDAGTVAASRICELLNGAIYSPELATCTAGEVHSTIDMMIPYGPHQATLILWGSPYHLGFEQDLG